MKLHHPLRHLFALAVVALAAATGSPVMAAPPPGIPDGWSDGYVYANGIRIHYHHAKPAPGKPVIVMVHGVTDIGLCWTTLTWELENDYDIYMLDARGHGLTDPFTSSDDGDTLIKDVVAFVETMGFEKPILMGHSMGGATVIRVGAEYPDLAKAIVVLDAGIRGPGRRPGAGAEGDRPPPPPPPPASSDPLAFAMQAEPEVLVKQNNYKFEDLVAKSRRQHPKWGEADHHYWALSKKQYHGAYSAETFREVMQGSMRSGDSLARIPVPMIILKADAPPEQRAAHQEAASVMQKGRLVHIDDAGHNLHHDQLARTVEVLNGFLSTLPR
ncbi:MAG TPA: alpha/beta hydrolase [Lacunisphaera sp.]|nr:alpha/beta hydrolase [Lacunisphaera sp.]